MKKIITIVIFLFALNLPFTVINQATANNHTDDNTESARPATGVAVPTEKGNCTPGSGTVCITNPLGTLDTPQKFIGRVISGLLGVIGSIALVMFVLGGFTWMTSAGDKTKVTKGRDTMLWAVLGLTVVFSSYALVKFVIEKVAG